MEMHCVDSTESRENKKIQQKILPPVGTQGLRLSCPACNCLFENLLISSMSKLRNFQFSELFQTQI